jgi:hypothetical protein
MHHGDLEKEITVNEANLRCGGSVPEWEGHFNIWECGVRARMLHNLCAASTQFPVTMKSIFVNAMAKRAIDSTGAWIRYGADRTRKRSCPDFEDILRIYGSFMKV